MGMERNKTCRQYSRLYGCDCVGTWDNSNVFACKGVRGLNLIISDNQKDYSQFLLEPMNVLEEYEVKGIAVVALTPNENLTGYWNMDLKDKLTAENEIRFDNIDEFIRVNFDRYEQGNMSEGVTDTL